MASPISATMPLSRCWTTERVTGSTAAVIYTCLSIFFRGQSCAGFDTPAPHAHQLVRPPVKLPFRALDLEDRQACEIGRRSTGRLHMEDGFGDRRERGLEVLRGLDDDDVL